MDWMETLPPPLRLLSRVIDIALVVLGSLIILIIFVNALSRYLINADLTWSLEILTLCMLWATFLGCAGAAARCAHMRATGIAFYFFRDGARRWLEILIDGVACTILVVLIYYGIKISIATWEQETTVLYWPIGLRYASMPVGMFFTLLFVLNRLFRRLANRPIMAHHVE